MPHDFFPALRHLLLLHPGKPLHRAFFNWNDVLDKETERNHSILFKCHFTQETIKTKQNLSGKKKINLQQISWDCILGRTYSKNQALAREKISQSIHKHKGQYKVSLTKEGWNFEARFKKKTQGKAGSLANRRWKESGKHTISKEEMKIVSWCDFGNPGPMLTKRVRVSI